MSGISFQRIETVKSQAIAFYEKEHILQSNERKQLSEFFGEQYDRMLYSSVSCMGMLGLGLPLIFKKRVRFIESSIVGLLIGSVSSRFVTNRLYYQHLEKFRETVGETSNIFETVKVTPDPINSAGFWSGYFKVSSENPNIRMRDPKSITNSSSYILFDGIPGKINSNQPQRKSLEDWNESEKSIDGKPEQLFSQSQNPSFDSMYDQKSEQKSILDNKLFEFETSTEPSTKFYGSEVNTIDDLSNPFSIPFSSNSDLQTDPFKLDKDQPIIHPQESSENAWDRIRRESGRS
jgi:hypothetical protein